MGGGGIGGGEEEAWAVEGPEGGGIKLQRHRQNKKTVQNKWSMPSKPLVRGVCEKPAVKNTHRGCLPLQQGVVPACTVVSGV